MKRLKEFILEMFTVMIGILIALLINNWNDERKENKYLEQIYVSIHKELEESVDGIKETIPLQLASIDTIQAYLNDEKVSVYDLLIKTNGIHGPNIKTTSWSALANSKIELIEYDRLSALTDIESRKRNLSDRLSRQVDFIYQNLEDNNKGKKEMLRIMLLDIVGAERFLQSEIEKLMKDYPIASD